MWLVNREWQGRPVSCGVAVAGPAVVASAAPPAVAAPAPPAPEITNQQGSLSFVTKISDIYLKGIKYQGDFLCMETLFTTKFCKASFSLLTKTYIF